MLVLFENVAAFARTRVSALAIRTLASAATAMMLLASTWPLHAAERLRLIIETDAGGDPDDEQSLVRFLLYANEWDVEGIIANRPVARERENLNPERTGLAIVRRQLKAYHDCYDKLRQHDPRYPSADDLWKRTVGGYNHVEDGVQLIIDAVDKEDPRPIWFLNWGTDRGAAESCLKRALDHVLAQRGQEGYALFKSKLRLSSDDQFGEHTTKLDPPFPIWVDTFRPALEGKRWYHRFSELTRNAGGFDIERDVRTGHGPLGELYPTNTTHQQKEGDTPTFLYLIPTGLSDPEHPQWGSWPGRYGPHDEHPGKPYFWANRQDSFQGKPLRDNTLLRWVAAIQNDFAARMDWCVADFKDANHPPQVRVAEPIRSAKPGERLTFDATATTDPDKNELDFTWFIYPEATDYSGELPKLEGGSTAIASFVAPKLEKTGQKAELHLILAVTDRGTPPLTRYSRQIVAIAE